MVREDSGRGDGEGRVTASEGGVRRTGRLGGRALQRQGETKNRATVRITPGDRGRSRGENGGG